MKKIIAFVMLLALSLSLVSCTLTETVFTNAFNRNDINVNQIVAFLNSDKVSNGSRSGVGGSFALPADKLAVIFEECGGRAASGAMSRLEYLDPQKAYELGNKYLDEDPFANDMEKFRSAMYGVSHYFSVNKKATQEEKDAFIARLEDIAENVTHKRVKESAQLLIELMQDK